MDVGSIEFRLERNQCNHPAFDSTFPTESTTYVL